MGLEGRGLSGGRLRMRSRTFGFLKMRGVSWLAAELQAFQQGLCSLDLVNIRMESYVYWTVHHLDSWINRDHLDVTCFFISLFNAQHVSDVNTSILRSLRLIVKLFHGLYCSGSMCVGVTLWFDCGGVVSVCTLRQCLSVHYFSNCNFNKHELMRSLILV